MRREQTAPPFFFGKAELDVDFMASAEKARVLCDIIEQAWAKAGAPHVRAEPVERHIDKRRYWGVETTGLVNGLPVRTGTHG